MTINERLAALRTEMAKNGLDAYIIPSSDPHQSEYVADRWKSREWISGFTGSAGTVVITKDEASLWTDSRYFIQAEMELEDSEFELHKMTNQFIPQYIEWLAQILPQHTTVGMDGWVFSVNQEKSFKTILDSKNINLKSDIDLMSLVWADRSELPKAPIFQHDTSFCGKSCKDKLEEIRSKMKAYGANQHIVTTLDDIAWIFNIRSNDVEFNPVAIAYTIIGLDTATLFIDIDKVGDDVRNSLEADGIIFRPYTDIIQGISELSAETVLLADKSTVNLSITRAIQCKVISKPMPSRLLKAVKNETEIAHLKKVMVKDAVAIAKTFYWLEQNIDQQDISEFDFSEKLAFHRSQQSHYYGESFAAIIGYKGNGAIVHYRPYPDTASIIKSDGILLCDSGGQYFDGTTDITRTVTLGNPTAIQKDAYTRILKGHIALAKAEFPEGTTGGQLDILARHSLWQNGMNYLHGTGHGVGFFLNVHEPPQGFAPGNNMRAVTVLKEGMYSSNEPGYYEAGEYGMRIENLMITTKSEKKGYLKHDTITLYPLDHKLLDRDLLTEEEIEWFNDYHALVWKHLEPAMPTELKDWMKEQCRPIN